MQVFRCSTTKETTLAVCSTKSSVQIPNIYTLRYAVIKNYCVVIGIEWFIIVVIRRITACRDTALATLSGLATFATLTAHLSGHLY